MTINDNSTKSINAAIIDLQNQIKQLQHKIDILSKNQLKEDDIEFPGKAKEADHAKTADTAKYTSETENAVHAGYADNANKIVSKYTTGYLTTVATITTKYIKLADCAWTQKGTLEVYLSGNNFEDTIIINYGGGNGLLPMLCGYYTSNDNKIISVIAKKGSTRDGNYSIWIKIAQVNTTVVNVSVLRGSCTINISETTTAPENIFEWAIDRGYWGTFTGNISSPNITALENRISALESKVQ